MLQYHKIKLISPDISQYFMHVMPSLWEVPVFLSAVGSVEVVLHTFFVGFLWVAISVCGNHSYQLLVTIKN